MPDADDLGALLRDELACDGRVCDERASGARARDDELAWDERCGFGADADLGRDVDGATELRSGRYRFTFADEERCGCDVYVFRVLSVLATRSVALRADVLRSVVVRTGLVVRV